MPTYPGKQVIQAAQVVPLLRINNPMQSIEPGENDL
jgi:hypothetical protein